MTRRKPDTTGKDVGHDAGQFLSASKDFAPDQEFYARRLKGTAYRFKLADVVSFAASLVNQSADHEERETIRKGKLPRGHKIVRRHKAVRRRRLHK